MNALSGMSALGVSKKALSMFLRTRCQKELFFSLHRGPDMAAMGLPEPIKRPGIGILSVEGKAFEAARNDEVVSLFPGIVRASKSVAGAYSELDLENELTKLTSAPLLILQGKFSIKSQQQAILQTIGLPPVDIAAIPPISDFVPDIVYIRDPGQDDTEVMPDGTRRPISLATETRLALCIIDIKHTAEANPSYCSEIALYALMMSNWLQSKPLLHDRFFVTTNALLWTRSQQGKSALDVAAKVSGASPQVLLDALVKDAESARLRYYLSAIRGFFVEVAKAVRVGLSGSGAWAQLDWHVASSCSSCDWLGDKRHMGSDQRAKVDANPTNYCMSLARAGGHLCLVPGITRGAKKVLAMNTVPDIAALAAASGHTVFQSHTLLKREAKTLPKRSSAIISKTLTNDAAGTIASLVQSAHLLLYATVNFDSSSGLLSGLAISGVATNFQTGKAPTRFKPVPFIVDQKSLAAEWVALEGFLTQIAAHIKNAELLVAGGVNGQVHFWEQRQFTELCNAIGRHLPRVMALSERKAKALAWIFAPDDLLPSPDSISASTVVMVDEIVRRLVFAPTPHVITLFDTAEHYRPIAKITRDSYYREYLTSGIPRERIYEIWSQYPQIKRGSTNIPRNTVISQFADALETQCTALEGICEQLRIDYKGRFRAGSTQIPTTIPQGARSVPVDAKLWIWWDELNFNTAKHEAHIRLGMDGERLEAGYEAILLSGGTLVAGDEYEFTVNLSSREAKFKSDTRLTLGKIGEPGMPLQTLHSLIAPSAPIYAGTINLGMRFWSSVEAKLVQFDRSALRARVRLSSQDPQLVPYLIKHARFDLLNDVFLAESKPLSAFNWAMYAGPIFSAIGQPSIAVPDANAAKAMGIKVPVKAKGTSAVTPAARVLWTPGLLEKSQVMPMPKAQGLATAIGQADGLNSGQVAAVAHGISCGLTLIWGPPGTGKTNTLASMLHAMVVDANQQGCALRVLLVGPTYKAVEEVLGRALRFIEADTNATCELWMGHSRGRTLTQFTTSSTHVRFTPYVFEHSDPGQQQFVQSCAKNAVVNIVGAQVRQSRRFADFLGTGGKLAEVFDVVIIDESSQVPVSQAVAALTGLKTDGRLIIAGDHMQMPPIVSVEAPIDAAYLVGSIQTYLMRRQFNPAVGQCVLERNYRSNSDIVDFARHIGYPVGLTAEFPHAKLHWMAALPSQMAFPVHLPWCNAFDRLLEPATKVATLLHQDDISSQGNSYEARLVAGMVWLLRKVVSAELDDHQTPNPHAAPNSDEFWRRCVGIVTPHRAQRALVVQELERLWPAEADLIADAVDTVERFQGGQRHTIIVSFGVADVDVIGGEEAFLMQLERTNVAVSRAMAKCIVVMPDALAAHIPEDKRALDTAYALKDYIEEFCNIRQPAMIQLGSDYRAGEVRYRK